MSSGGQGQLVTMTLVRQRDTRLHWVTSLLFVRFSVPCADTERVWTLTFDAVLWARGLWPVSVGARDALCVVYADCASFWHRDIVSTRGWAHLWLFYSALSCGDNLSHSQPGSGRQLQICTQQGYTLYSQWHGEGEGWIPPSDNILQ